VELAYRLFEWNNRESVENNARFFILVAELYKQRIYWSGLVSWYKMELQKKEIDLIYLFLQLTMNLLDVLFG